MGEAHGLSPPAADFFLSNFFTAMTFDKHSKTIPQVIVTSDTIKVVQKSVQYPQY